MWLICRRPSGRASQYTRTCETRSARRNQQESPIRNSCKVSSLSNRLTTRRHSSRHIPTAQWCWSTATEHWSAGTLQGSPLHPGRVSPAKQMDAGADQEDRNPVPADTQSLYISIRVPSGLWLRSSRPTRLRRLDACTQPTMTTRNVVRSTRATKLVARPVTRLESVSNDSGTTRSGSSSARSVMLASETRRRHITSRNTLPPISG